MTSPYRELGRSPTWYKSNGDALRISEIRSICFYESRKYDAFPCTIVFKSGPNICLTKEDGQRLVELLND